MIRNNILLLHPGILVLFFVIILSICKNFRRIFNVLSLLIPIIAILLVIYADYGTYHYQFYNLWQILFEYNFYNKGICICLLICALIINFSTISKKSKESDNATETTDIIFSILYLGASLVAILANDFFTTSCSLELMALASSVIIFHRSNDDRIQASYQYFSIHFLSGILILSGSIIITENYGIKILSLTKIITNINYSHEFLGSVMLLIGILINLACPPFSQWLTNSYSVSSATGSSYLSILTTKVNLILLLKLFAGLNILIFIGIFMSIFGIIYSILENNIRKSICYTAITKFGVIITAIGQPGSEELLPSVIIPLCISHISYQALLSLLGGWLEEKYKIKYFSDFNQYVKLDFIIILGLIIGISSIFAIPFMGSYYSKVLLGQLYISHQSHVAYNILNIITAAQLLFIPWVKFKRLIVSYSNQLQWFEKGAIIAFIILNTIAYPYLFSSDLLKTVNSYSITAQLIIIATGVICTIIIKPDKSFIMMIRTPEYIINVAMKRIMTIWAGKKFQFLNFNSKFFQNKDNITAKIVDLDRFLDLSSFSLASTIILMIISIITILY